MRTINCTITKIATAANAGLQMVARTISVSRASNTVAVVGSVSRGVFGFVGQDIARLLRSLGLQLPALLPTCLATADYRHRNEGQVGKAGKLTTVWSIMPPAGSPGIASIG